MFQTLSSSNPKLLFLKKSGCRIGDKVPVAKKGRYGVVRGEAEALFSPYHLFVESSNAEDFNNDRILQQVRGKILNFQSNGRIAM